MPSRLATSRIVSSSRPLTSRPFSVKVTIGASDCTTSFLVIAFILYSSASVPERTRPGSGQFLREILDHAVDRVRRGLAQTADRRIAHHERKIGQRVDIPLVVALDELDALGGADTAGRALTAGLVLEEAHHVARSVGSGVLVGQ